eukprot:CAMPEP_0172562964 /NCGR_PEP_ID=MMETSP1067-20121228/99015_1 /TAXON_ID=265564 ORGANISM="Thalassiosira punctigera, Strain Tpunct2005C2" /NCGR_SAMPLE_ID=MMETSP1067 /ASSEMBLY_ACC=CAM_ASM_000444 /LENGTH=46 /DNA_ID= /DNA_START= /DNA_END= /DNA_ORIENTATION=
MAVLLIGSNKTTPDILASDTLGTLSSDSNREASSVDAAVTLGNGSI